MDNHPIPQDVTGFKFKLIGSITVRQFSYLLFGSIIAYIFFALPLFILIKIPFVLFFAVLGVMLAFVPIDGRPMDLMFMNFLRAIPRDNQWIYQKKGVDLSFFDFHGTPHQQIKTQTIAKSEDDNKRRRLAQLLATRNNSTSDLSQHEVDFLGKMKGFFAEQALTQSSTQPVANPMLQHAQSAPTAPIQQLSTQTSPIHQNATQQSINAILMEDSIVKPTPTKSSKESTEEIQPQSQPELKKIETAPALQEVLPQTLQQTTAIPNTQTLEHDSSNEVKSIAKEINHQKATAGQSSNDTSRVKTLTGDATVAAGFPILPDIPNIIIGIIKDPRGKVMSNILVEIFDKNDIPVRAFKTNALGQFASATPLPDGTYTMRFEDPMASHEFDTIEITLNSEIFQPLEITSLDSREKLRLELFG